MNILVSVIIPCHNSEKHIELCLDSVLKQSYKNIEIICVENNSTDDTLVKLNAYSQKYSDKIVVLPETRQGASLARNMGLEKAKGEWVQFLDADDILLPNKIITQIELLTSNGADLIVGNYIKQENENKEKISQIKDVWDGLIKGRLGFTSSNLWKKNALEKVGGWDDIKSSQEAHLMFKFLKQNAKVLFDETFNTIKIERRNSISRTNVKDNIIRYIELRMAIWAYLNISEQLTVDILDVLKTNVFDSIRILYSEDKESAISLHNKYVKDKFEPIKSSSTSLLYLFLYKMFGFKLTQKIVG